MKNSRERGLWNVMERGMRRGWKVMLGSVCLLVAVLGLCMGQFADFKQRSAMAMASAVEKAAAEEKVKQGGYDVGDAGKMKSESETQSESESESKSEMQSESESESDSEMRHRNAGEAENWGRTESEHAGRPESKSVTEKAEGGETDNWSEVKHELKGETIGETRSEGETRKEEGADKQRKTEEEPEHGVNTEDVTEAETTDTEASGETAETTETEVSGETAKTTETEAPGETAGTTETEASSETAGITETESSGETAETTKMEPERVIETEQPHKTEILREKIYRGKQYEVRGEKKAWYRDEHDRLWVRAGSSLYVDTKDDSGYSGGFTKENIQKDGELTFSFQRVDEDGTAVAESFPKKETYYVDGEAPGAEIAAEGTALNGMIYAAQSGQAVIWIAPDGKSGLKSAAYAVIQYQEGRNALYEPENAIWQPCDSGTQVTIQAEGMYQLYVRTEDNVGNFAFSKSSVICVDKTPPEIEVSGVGNQTANAGKVQIKASCSDAHYKPGSMKVELLGRNSGRTPAVYQKEESEHGAVTEYFDFPKQKSYDDMYQLHIHAEDLAGNVAEKTVDFSVNRFGSVYDLSPETRKNLQQYYLAKAEDVTFYETNIDYVGESDIFCRRDGELQELTRGKDYQVTMQGSKDSWKQYQYTVPAGYFEKEGVYELLLSSRDEAWNQSDTGMQEKRVAFVLDWTAPECTVTGVKPQTVYEEAGVTACFVPQDNIGLKTVRVYHNSELLRENKEKKAEPVKIHLKASEEWQTLQIFLQDLSGNEYWSEELPVFIGKRAEDVSPYQKIRASAQEKEEQRKNGKDKTKEGKEGEWQNIKNERIAGGKQAEAYTDDNTQNRTMGEGKEGIVLLILGGIMFLVTAVSFIITGLQRKS